MKKRLSRISSFISSFLRRQSFGVFAHDRSLLNYTYLKERSYCALSRNSHHTLYNPFLHHHQRVPLYDGTRSASSLLGAVQSFRTSGNWSTSAIRSTSSNFSYLRHHRSLSSTSLVCANKSSSEDRKQSCAPFSNILSASASSRTTTTIDNLAAHNMAKPREDTHSNSHVSPIANKPETISKKRKAEVISRTKGIAVRQTGAEDSMAVATESPRPKRRAAKKVKVELETDEEIVAEETVGDVKLSSESKRVSTKKTVVEETTVDSEEEEDVKIVNKTKAPSKKTTKNTKKVDDGEAKPKKVTKSKAKPVKVLPPIAERTKDIKLRVGAHVSIAGGVHNAILNVVHIGGNAFAMFMKNQRKWETVDMDPEHAQFFVQWCKDHSIDAAECCLPHGSYLVNLAHPDPARKKQAYDSFLNDLTRCHRLGIRYYNFHPGNANATTHEEGIRIIAENLNRAHADPETGKVVTVLETMATLGNTIGGTFSDLAAIIKLVDDKSRVGVCLDTCHVFAAGYDLRTPEAYAETMKQFDEEIGLEYLKAFHVNDSKAPLSSHRDLHARIGTGYLGLESFHNLMNDERFHGLPMVLETPIDIIDKNGKKMEDKGVWAREIKMLESLVGMSVNSEEFKTLSAQLQEEGAAERERVGDQVQRKSIKDAKPKSKKAAKGKVEKDEENDLEE